MFANNPLFSQPQSQSQPQPQPQTNIFSQPQSQPQIYGQPQTQTSMFQVGQGGGAPYGGQGQMMMMGQPNPQNLNILGGANYNLQNMQGMEYGRMTSLNQGGGLNIQPPLDQIFQWKTTHRIDPFSLSMGNPNRDKDVSGFNLNFRQVLTNFQNFMEENKKNQKICEENRNNIVSTNKTIKDDLYAQTNNSVRLRTDLKKQIVSVTQLKLDVSYNVGIVNDFIQYCDWIKKGKLPIIQLPSLFLQIVSDKMMTNLENLKNKIVEIEELSNLQINSEDTTDRDYENFLVLITELYYYYNYVAYLVIRFNESYHDLKSRILESLRGLGFNEIEKPLEVETRKKYKDEMIDNLMSVLNKLEEIKKTEKIELEKNAQIEEKDKLNRRNMIFKSTFQDYDSSWTEKMRKRNI